ncbi:MAG: hypothetical protein KDK91_15300, partial [Gammaproteobacteria bacterium]|nr:hypothetical protein [Gammaproteobacteria bacterium]
MILIPVGLFALAGTHYLDHRAHALAGNHLASARIYLEQQRGHVEKYLEQQVLTTNLPTLLAERTPKQTLDEVLATRADAARLDFLIILDQSGRVIASSSGTRTGTQVPVGFVLREALNGVLTSSYERLDGTTLQAISPRLADRAGPARQPAAGPPVAPLGLLISAGTHFPLTNEHADAVLYGGILLNDNVGLIERLRDVVFPVSEGAPRVDGVTALFLAGRQVATSLQYPDDPD